MPPLIARMLLTEISPLTLLIMAFQSGPSAEAMCPLVGLFVPLWQDEGMAKILTVTKWNTRLKPDPSITNLRHNRQ